MFVIALGDDSRKPICLARPPPRLWRAGLFFFYRRPPTLKDNTKDFADNGRSQVPDEAMAAPKVPNISIMLDGDGDQVRRLPPSTTINLRAGFSPPPKNG